MSERLQHRNPWAEKLSQVSLPDMEGCWAAMETRLDREMPKGWWKDWRRWLLLILILLLLIGVCECPGRRWLSAGSSAGDRGAIAKSSAPEGGTVDSGGTESGTVKGGGTKSGGTESGGTPVAGAGKTGGGSAGGSGASAEKTAGGSSGKTGGGSGGSVGKTAEKTAGGSGGTIPDSAKKDPRTLRGKEATRPATGDVRVVEGNGVRGSERKSVPGSERKDVTGSVRKSVPGSDSGVARKPARGVTRAAGGVTPVVTGDAGRSGRKKKTNVSGADLTEAGSGAQPGAPGGPEQAARQNKAVPETILPDSIRKKPAAKLSPALPDSTAKKKRPEKPATKQPPATQQPPDEKEKKRNDGWLAAIGLNQFFTIGGQRASSYNSGGLSGALGDYIPIPMVRYYPEPDLYIQLEVQINTPQYTKKNLVASVSARDSVSPVQTVQETVAINKLFYFNVPVSVHYTVLDHLDLGAGLQYSRLTNGIGVFNSNYNTSGVDSLATETKSFKGDSGVYKEIKTHEFRFLVDANYNWRHFIFGLRYNQALSKFIHVEVSPGQVTQARNSSLQLYLRYILWDDRKKKPSLPAK